MKKMFERKKQILLLVLIFGLVGFGGWKYFELTKPIDIGHPKKGDFVKVGKMPEPRYNHESVLLDDGTVLIFGGNTIKDKHDEKTNTADIYDPTTKEFTPVGNMNEHREKFTATKLNNGKVLIAGGRSGYTSEKSTEFYNPIKKSFEKGPDMNISRESHTATLLKDGRVLIVGGSFNFANKESEIYNPTDNKFEITAKINIPRYEHSAILLKDGRVLIIGGFGIGPKFPLLASAEIYNIKTNKFESVGNMSIARKSSNIYLLKNGNVLISGGLREGLGDKLFVRQIELYNPKNNQFKVIAKRLTPPRRPSEVLLNNDNILFVGGGTGVGLSTIWYKTSEIFNPKTKDFVRAKDMSYARTCHKTTLLKDGNVLVTGSYGEGKTAELYIYEDKK